MAAPARTPESTEVHGEPDYAASNIATGDMPDGAGSLETAQIALLAVDALVASDYNPRQHFDPAGLQELADSLAAHGMLQPIVARPLPSGRCEIVAGERRWRAARQAGLQTVPVRLVRLSDRQARQLAIVENLHRRDLDPIEQAQGYRALAEDLGMKQTAIAAAVKASQPTIAKALGLLKLPAEVQEQIRTGALSPGHGHILEKWAAFPQYVRALAQAAIDGGWTTKQLAEAKLYVSWQMIDAGVVRRLGGMAHFDTAICQQCPFGAYRAEHAHSGYCLNPRHYDELQAAAQAAERARVAAAAEKAAVAGGPAVLMLADLSMSSYERLDYQRPPAACTAACPCRALALDREGGQVRICTDPKRFRELKAQQERAEKKARRDAARERIAGLAAGLADAEGTGGRELALLVYRLLLHGADTPAIRAAGDYHAPGWSWLKKGEKGGTKPTREEWLELEPAQIVRVAADALLRKEILQQVENNWGGTEDADWYGGKAGKGKSA